jgi:hypothetical protein
LLRAAVRCICPSPGGSGAAVDRVAGELDPATEGIAVPGERSSRPRWGPWSLLAAYAVLAAGALALHVQRQRIGLEDLLDTAVFLIFVVVGGFIAARRPGNPIGWLLCVAGVASVFSRFVAEYVATAAAGTALPGAAIVAWLDLWVWTLGLGSGLILLPLLYPDGHLPSPRWRMVGWLAVIAFAVPTAAYAFAPGPFASLPSIANPFGLEPLGAALRAGQALLVPAVALSAIACAAAPISRFRSAPPEERQQLKWFAFAAGLLVIALLANIALGDATYILLVASLALVPIAIGVAILRYRLYEIDVIINMTLVWVPLTGILGGLYAGLVALLQRVFVNVTGDRSDAAIIITTLVLAGSFTPIRRVLDTIVDRRFRSPATAHSGQAAGGPDQLSFLDDPEAVRRIEEIAERVAVRVNRSDR